MTEQIGTLNTIQIREKHKIMNEYRDFWQTHQHSKVDNDLIELLFERAAEISIRVEEEDRLFKTAEEQENGDDVECEQAIRKEGSSESLFWDVSSINPSEDPSSFVRSLVLSTLKDANIPEERVDAFIAKFDALYPMDKWLNHEVSFAPEMAKKFAALASEVAQKAEKLRNAVTSSKDPMNYHTDRDFAFVIESLLAQLTSISDELDVQLAPTPVLPAKPSEPEVEKMEVENSAPEKKEEEVKEAEAMEVTEQKPTAADETQKGDENGMKIESKREKDDIKVEVKEEGGEEPKEKIPRSSTEMDVEEKAGDAMETVDPEEEKRRQEEEEKKRIDDLTKQGTLKIENVAGNVAKLRPQIDEFKKNTDLLDLNALTQDPIEGVKKVDKLQKKCREYSEYLMRDLLTLDGIAGTEAIRPIRKARVGEIQQLMDRMDEISHHLTRIYTDLEKDAKAEQERLEAEAAKKRAEEEAKKKAEQERLEAEAAKKREEKEARIKQVVEEAAQIEWDQLRLEPKFHAQEASGSYVISASIPGMSTKDIGLRMTDDGNVLEISGLRKPTEEEIVKVVNLLESNPKVAARYAEMDRKEAMKALGRGRFGKFVKKFEIPDDAIVDRMSASYDNGILKVVIPRMIRNRGFFPAYDYDSFW